MISRWFKNLSVRRKLTAITLCVATTALVSSLLTYTVVQLKMARDHDVRDLHTLAEVVAANAAGPLAFRDKDSARDTLESLRARHEIKSARLLTSTREVFAEFALSPEATEALQTDPRSSNSRGVSVVVCKPVIHAGEPLGELQISADLTEGMVRMTLVGAGVGLVILAAALALAYILINRLQRAVSAPVTALATAAREVASKQDYSLRVERTANDEIGDLTDAFNHMLQQVSGRDLELSAAKEQLAQQVVALKHEIGERERVEHDLHRAKEAAESANHAKSVFLATMSHEIRTPMNGVLATASLLLDSPLNDEQRELAGLIRVSGEGLLTILNDILDLSKLEAGRVVLERTDFDLRELVDDAVELHAVAAAGKGLDVAAEVLPGTPYLVNGDPFRLRQVLMNLVGNAVKFTTYGEVVVAVSLTTTTEGRNVFHFAIRDTGIGLSSDAQQRLFRPFTQADSSMTRRYGGTGLGLAISKALIELMGGTIGVQSAIGEGSTFWFTVPLVERPQTPGTSEPADALKGRRLLFLETNPSSRLRLCALLDSWGVHSTVVSSPHEALSEVQRQPSGFDVALVSTGEASTASLTVAARLREDTRWAGKPVIIVTTQKERASFSNLQPHGVAAVLFRPVRGRHLAATLRRVLGAETPTTGETALPAPGPNTKPVRILLAEDNVVNQRVATLALQRLGCETSVAVDGLRALELLDRHEFDLVLMDCQMPELDGFETTRRIRREECSGRWTRRGRQYIVAMTANSMQGDRERCLAAGMDDYLSKPLTAGQLERVVAEAASRRP